MSFSVLLSFLITGGTIGLSVLLSFVAPTICWPPRIGALLVGLSVFAQGYIAADPKRLSRRLQCGITLQQRVMHISYVAALFGTLFGAFGDFLPPIFGHPTCYVK